MLRKIDRVILRVPSLEAAVRYYRDTLGLSVLRQEKHIASFRLADGTTELVLHDDPDQPSEAVYYLVNDVRDLHARRDELGLKFISLPKQVTRGYSAMVRDPFGTVLLLLDRTTESSAASGAVEDARSPGALFAGVEPRVPTKRQTLIDLYVKIGRTADDLPYTPHFESLYRDYSNAHGDEKPTRQEVWRHLLNLRKGGKLPKLGEARSESPDVGQHAEQILRELLGNDIGKRDRLPYTPRFDEIVDRFNKVQPRPISPHLVWRLVAKLAK